MSVRRRNGIGVTGAMAIALAWAVPTLAYEVVDVLHGGTIEGRLRSMVRSRSRKASTSLRFPIQPTVGVFPMDEVGDSFVISW